MTSRRPAPFYDTFVSGRHKAVPAPPSAGGRPGFRQTEIRVYEMCRQFAGGKVVPSHFYTLSSSRSLNPETEIAYAVATGLRTETGTRQRYGNPVYFSIVIGRIPATVRRQQAFISGYEMRRTQHCPSLCIYFLHTDIAGHASSLYHPGLSGCPNLNPFLSCPCRNAAACLEARENVGKKHSRKPIISDIYYFLILFAYFFARMTNIWLIFAVKRRNRETGERNATRRIPRRARAAAGRPIRLNRILLSEPYRLSAFVFLHAAKVMEPVMRRLLYL